MKVNKQLLAKTIASLLLQNNSIKITIDSLVTFNLISATQHEELLIIIKDADSLSEIFTYLKFDKLFIEYTLFFSSYYTLAQAIEKAVELIENRSIIKKEIISSLIYPVILIIFTSLALTFISNFILPQLMLLNPQAKNQYSMILLFLDVFPKIIIIFLSTSILFTLLVIYLIKYRFTYFIKHFYKLPIIKQIIKIYVSLNFTLYLKEIIKNIPLNSDAIVILNKQANNIFIKHLTNQMIIQLKQGNHLFDIIKDNQLLLDDFKQTIYLSLNSQNLYILIDNYYNLKFMILQKKIKSFLIVLVPIIISIIGFVLVLMYILIMMPILDMNTDF